MGADQPSSRGAAAVVASDGSVVRAVQLRLRRCRWCSTELGVNCICSPLRRRNPFRIAARPSRVGPVELGSCGAEPRPFQWPVHLDPRVAMLMRRRCPPCSASVIACSARSDLRGPVAMRSVGGPREPARDDPWKNAHTAAPPNSTDGLPCKRTVVEGPAPDPARTLGPRRRGVMNERSWPWLPPATRTKTRRRPGWNHS